MTLSASSSATGSRTRWRSTGRARASAGFGNTGFPETWFVGRDGRLVGEHIVGPFDREQLEENVQAALDTPER